MKLKIKDIDLTAIPPEPTIWALRKNPRAANEAAADDHSLYEHLFGYDPIRMIGSRSVATEDAAATSAENPNLNILNAGTNFAVMEMASEMEPEDEKAF